MPSNLSEAVPSSTGRPRRAWVAPRHRALWIVWHVLTGAALLMLASQWRFAAPVWTLTSGNRLFVAGLAGAYAFAVGTVLWRATRPGGVRFRDVILIVALAFGIASFAFLVLDPPTSRSLLLAATAVTLIAVLLPFLPMPRGVVIVLVVVSAAAFSAVARNSIESAAWANVRRQVFNTPFHSIELQIIARLIQSQSRGGALDVVDNTLLIAAGDGRLYAAELSSSPLTVRRLPYRIPLNLEDFASQTESRVSKQDFRVADILARETAGNIELLASHHHWNGSRRCFTVRISRTTSPRAAFLAGTAQVAWQTVFDTDPCMPLKSDPAQPPFSGDQAGGRMLDDGGAVLMTVGDYAHDGWSSTDLVSQDPLGHYGKIVRVELRGGASEVYSSGHRNPQGLARGLDGRVWSTEHGPYGGDELNLIERGGNYGWPNVTLGVDYGQHKWPLSASQGTHAGYQAPTYAWVPSLGISSLISLRGDAFTLWAGDLLVATLNAGTLFRLRLDGDRVVFAEPIRVGERIRDLAEGPDGRILMLFDSGGIGTLTPVPDGPNGESGTYFTPEMRGELLYSSCLTCHGPGGTAPGLAGVVGRRVGAVAGYPYSPALLKLGGTWTDNRLDEFLADTNAFAPGTSMRLGSIRDASDRRSLIAHLKTVR